MTIATTDNADNNYGTSGQSLNNNPRLFGDGSLFAPPPTSPSIPVLATSYGNNTDVVSSFQDIPLNESPRRPNNSIPSSNGTINVADFSSSSHLPIQQQQQPPSSSSSSTSMFSGRRIETIPPAGNGVVHLNVIGIKTKKPESLSRLSSSVWDDLSRQITPLTLQIKMMMICYAIMGYIFVGAFFFHRLFSDSFRGSGDGEDGEDGGDDNEEGERDEKDEVFSMVHPFFAIILVEVIVLYGALFLGFRRKKAMDERARKICDELEGRFLSEGFKVTYFAERMVIVLEDSSM